jgi:hypothetical protein
MVAARRIARSSILAAYLAEIRQSENEREMTAARMPPSQSGFARRSVFYRFYVMYVHGNAAPSTVLGIFQHIKPRLEAGILHTGHESGGIGLIQQLHSAG